MNIEIEPEQVLTTLKSDLGSWMGFMADVEELLPFIMQSAGRPTKQQIENSWIGRLGFTSWKEMIESDAGLNWSFNTWKLYRRAWSIVKAHGWLRETDYTASQIVTLDRETDTFPGSEEVAKEHYKQREFIQEFEKTKSVANLKRELEEQISIALVLNTELSEEKQCSEQLRADISVLQAELDRLHAATWKDRLTWLIFGLEARGQNKAQP